MTALVDARPQRKVYLGLTAGLRDALSTVTWSADQAGKVAAMTGSRGAQHELSHVDPSSYTVLFDNRTRDFDPANTAGPHYPNLKPMNRLRVVDRWAGVDYTRATLYVVDWPASWDSIGSSVVQVQAIDALAVLNGIDIPASPWALEVMADIAANREVGGKSVWLRLGESQGSLVARDSSGHALDGDYQGGPGLGLVGLVEGDRDTAMSPAHSLGQRASLPYRMLISGYPWSFICRFRSNPDRTAAKMLFSGYDGAQAPSEYLQVLIAPETFGADAGKIVALIAHPYPTGTQSLSTITVDDGEEHTLHLVMAAAGSLRIWIDGVDRTDASIVTAVTWPSNFVAGYAVGNVPASTFGDFGFGTQDGDVLDEVVILDGLALDSARIVAHHVAAGGWVGDRTGERLNRLLDAIGWPSADRDIDDGVSLVQPGLVAGNALSYAQLLELTEGGRLFVDGEGRIVFHDRHRALKPPQTTSSMTFGEGAGEIGYAAPFKHGQATADLHNRVSVTRVGGITQTVDDLASQDDVGIRELPISGLLLTNDEEARDRAMFELIQYAEPVTRAREVTVNPQEDPAVIWPLLLGAELHDRATVTAQPPGAGPLFSQESLIEMLTEAVTGQEWQVTARFSVADTQGFAIAGTSLAGGASSRAGY